MHLILDVRIYDSLSHGHVTNHVKKQVAAILHEEGPEITLTIKSVQQQRNGTVCGVFSIAFLTSILHGHDPTTQIYKRDKLREHLLAWMNNGYVTPFPVEGPASRSKVKRFTKEPKIAIQLFCSCRMPWYKTDVNKKETRMASCDTCGEWYHQGCENIPDAIFQKHSFWECSKCTSAS